MMAKPRPQTIRIFLPSGNPRGIRKVERTSNSNIRLFEIPRAELGRFYETDEAAEMGIYFLTGAGRLYIGQTTDIGKRIREHDKTKTFWQRAFVVVLNNDFRTLDHLYCLEKTAIKRARAAGRLVLDNGTAGNTHRHLHDSIRSDCENIFDETDTLLAVLNQDFFTAQAIQPLETSKAMQADTPPQPLPERAAETVPPLDGPSENGAELFYCRSGQDVNTRAVKHEDGFLLLAESRLKLNPMPSLESHSKKTIHLRQQLLEQGIAKTEGSSLVLQQDYFVYGRPSVASDLVLGRPSNGWREWKNAAGQTLDEVFRKQTGRGG